MEGFRLHSLYPAFSSVQHSVRTCWVPGPVLGTGNWGMKKMGAPGPPRSLYSSREHLKIE